MTNYTIGVISARSVPSNLISNPTAAVVATDNLSSIHRIFSFRTSNVVDL